MQSAESWLHNAVQKSYNDWVEELETTVMDHFGHFSYREARGVEADSRREYESSCKDMNDFMEREDLTSLFKGTPQEVDASLVQLVHYRFFSGYDSGDGSKALAAFMFVRPQFSKLGTHHLPRTSRALRGWKKLAPSHSRPPPPFDVVCGLAVLTETFLPRAGTAVTVAD